MDTISALKNKRMKVAEVPNWGVYLRKQWEDSFANHMSDEEKRKIFMFNDDGCCGYLWHLFSYEKRASLNGEEAFKAFNNVNKSCCYIFYQHDDDVLIIEHAHELNASDILEKDIYVVDKEFNWTFVITHETGYCGPYFSSRI